MIRTGLTLLFFSLIQLVAFSQQIPWQQKVAADVRAAFDQGHKADILVVFKEQADLKGVTTLSTKLQRAQFAFTRLTETAERTQANARRILHDHQAEANSLFLVNAIAVSNADITITAQLAQLTEVAQIASDPWVKFNGPVEMSLNAPVTERNQVEWGGAKISAPEVWALGYTGQGITVGGADTGYEWEHPAIKPHYRGWDGSNADHNYNWHDAIHDYSPLNYDTAGNPGFNPCGLNSPVPCDDNNHGTHTMGTMTGDDGAGNMIGVAPGARWVGCRNMERGWGKPSSYLECFQWFMAPTDANDQNPDPSKAPHVINNSWYCAVEEGCTDQSIDNLFRQAVINLKASGVVVVISNGNEGPSCATTNHPAAYFEESFSIGATKDDDFVAGFSSRGPVLVDGSGRMKPNVSAPGQNVRSCVRGGGYANFSGTSMAGPHVVGLVALMLSAKPALAGHVEEIEDMIEQTTVFHADTLDCFGNSGLARPNHAYGWGRVDALGAVTKALEWQASGVTDPGNQPSVQVYPNPVQDKAMFLLANCAGKTVITLYDVRGAQVVSETFTTVASDLKTLSLAGAPAGVYTYRVVTTNGSFAGKIIKE